MLDKFGMDDSLNKHNSTNDNAKEGYLGVDIGSTSINFVVIDEDNKVVDYISSTSTYYETCWFKYKRRLCMCIYADFTKDN